MSQINEITRQNNRVRKGRELLLNGDIDSADYKAIKLVAEQEIDALEQKLDDLGTEPLKLKDVEGVLERSLSRMANIDIIFSKSDINKKKRWLIR